MILSLIQQSVDVAQAVKSRLKLSTLRDEKLGGIAERLVEMHGTRRMATVEHPDGSLTTWTYSEAAVQIQEWADRIRSQIKPGAPVVIATPNGFTQFLMSLAVAQAGGLPAPVNPQMRPVEIDHVVNDSGALLTIYSENDVNTLPLEPRRERNDVDASDVAALFYTSGTTGSPKGAALSHRSLLGQVSMASLWPFQFRDDELVVSLPTAHIMGFVALLGPAIAGVPVYMIEKFSPRRILTAIEARRSSAFIGVPAMYRLLEEARVDDYDLRSVRVWISGADVMPSDLAERFKSRGATAAIPGLGDRGEAMFIEGYGMVEVAGNVATKVSLPGLPWGTGESLGLRMPGWKLRVMDDDGERVRHGEIGELQLAGPGVLNEYWGDEAATNSVLTADGWLRTGDLVRTGPFGTVLFQGRVKAVIKSGGFSVYPVEIEADLEEHPDVLEAAVVGYPDDHLGEVPVAAVRLRPHSTLQPDALMVWAAARMAAYKTPRFLMIVDDLPRTGTRKLQRAELLPQFGAAIGDNDLGGQTGRAAAS